MTEEFMSSINKSVSDSQIQNKKSNNIFEKVAYIVFLITLILSPIAFISSSYASLDVTKTIVISLGILISSILFVISLLKQKSFLISKNSLTNIMIALMVSIIVSALLSTNPMKSFFGQGFEIGTASFLLLMFITAFLVSRLASNDKDRILYVYAGILISFLILILFHTVRFFAGPDFLSFGLLNTITSTLIGKWYDFGILTGVVGLLSFFGLQSLSLNKGLKLLLTILLIISGFILFVINSSLIWFSVAIVVFAFGIYQYLLKSDQNTGVKKIISRISIATLIVLIISIACAWKGNTLALPLIKSLKLEQTEVLLPWQLTIDVASETIKQSPLFGAGPNRFINQYLIYKPQVVNPTPFWAFEFGNGFAFIPTFLVTQGLVGAILWSLFLIFFVCTGIRALKKITDKYSQFIIGSTFFTTSFLLLISLIYFPSHVIVFLTFVFIGLSIASFITESAITLKDIESTRNYSVGKLSTTSLIIILLVLVVWIVIDIRKDVAIGYFQRGISALNLPNNQGIDKATSNFKKALALDHTDIYYQALSEVNIFVITTLAQKIQTQTQQGAKIPDPEIIKQISALVDEALGYTKSAIAIDPTNYYNYVAQARISELALSLQIPNAYENAKTAYNNAILYNPLNPFLYLNLARLEASQNKLAETQRNIGIALQLKQNYIEAIFFLSQIQVNQGQIKEAIISTQVATQINPDNPLLFFQLGLLQYNDKNYQEAINALTKAVELNSLYANARYFLGLSLSRLGRNQEAIKQFEEIAKTNPNSQEVAFILTNLRAGKSPFTDAQPPIDSKPEKRKQLPVKEKTTDTKDKTVN